MKTFSRNARLNLESLDNRIVPSATQLSLETRDAVVEQAGFVAFQGHTQMPEGSTLDRFLGIDGPRRQAEQGYNTDARPLQFNEARRASRTHSITLGDVPVVNRDGVNYREFVLDVNEGGSPRLSVDSVRIFLGSQGDLLASTAEAAGGVMTLNGSAPVFDLDANGDVALMLNARVKAGRGFGDMTLLVPDANFTGASINDFVYFYTKMGDQAGAHANGGFEDWAVRVPQTPVDPPTGGGGNETYSVSGFVTNDLGGAGIADVTIQLSGVDVNNQPVNLQTTTLADGSFLFSNLPEGTYTITEVQPSGFDDGQDFVGNSSVQEGEFPDVNIDVNDEFSNINLNADNGNATDFLFTELNGGE